MTEYGYRMRLGLGTGIALPDPPSYHYPGYTPPPTARLDHAAVPHRASYKCVVGLRSVDQLSLSTDFSDLRTMTEGYNLSEIGNR